MAFLALHCLVTGCKACYIQVGRLTKLLKVHVNPSYSTGFDVRELNLVYVSWMDR
jgi:hypothetical protein